MKTSLPGSSVGKKSTCNAEDPGSIPGSGRSTGEGIGYPFQYSWTSLVAQLVKNLPAMRETRPGFDPWVGKIPWRRGRLPTPVFWPGEFHGLYKTSESRDSKCNVFFWEAPWYAPVMPGSKLDRNVWRSGEGSKTETFKCIVRIRWSQMR